MFDKLLSPETIEETLRIVQNEFLLGIWETLYVTVIATALAIVIGLPLGVLLVAGEKNGVLPLPRPVIPDPDDYGISAGKADCGHSGGHRGIDCSPCDRGLSLCGAAGGKQPQGSEPEYH